MENTYVGLLQLPRGIICKNEVLGKLCRTNIGGVKVGVHLPVFVEGENKHRILRSAPAGIQYEIDWGYENQLNKTSIIKATNVLFCGTAEQAAIVYSSFPKWLNRFKALVKMHVYDFYRDSICQAIQRGEDGIADKETGLLLNQLYDGKWKYVHNPDNTILALLDSNMENEGFSLDELSRVIFHSGEEKPFSESHYFLSEACGAYQRQDNRGCVIFAGIALEYGIINRVKKYCKDHGQIFSPLGTLGNKFQKLKDLGIEIPIVDYKTRIVNYRNDVVHKGIAVSDSEAKKFWMDCSLLIQAYDNNLYYNDSDEKQNNDSISYDHL